jgi:hypothetical protein
MLSMARWTGGIVHCYIVQSNEEIHNGNQEMNDQEKKLTTLEAEWPNGSVAMSLAVLLLL